MLVDGSVSAVVFELDGKQVGRRVVSPWTADVDFGDEYTPHELVARALDTKGSEVARVRQWINVPRPPAEVQVLLEKNALGKTVAARLTWASRFGSKASRVTVTLDGRELSVDEARRVTLPNYDASIGHVFTARLEFPNGVRSRADLVLGGGSSDEAGSELTAVPVRVAGKRPPAAQDLQGRFLERGVSLNVTGVERGPATVVVVRDLDESEEAYQRLGGVFRRRFSGDGSELESDDQLQVQWPVTREIPDVEGSNILFEASRVFSGSGASLAFLLMRVGYPGESRQPRRFADAVAVAALQASASCSRRTVILVLGSSGRDESHVDPASVRRYLQRLHVPLYVWSLGGRSPDVPARAWGDFEDTSTVASFSRAVDRVRKDLQSQAVVWVEGRHLPQEITLRDDTTGIEIAR